MSVVSRDVANCPVCGSPAVLVDSEDEGFGKLYTVICLNVHQCGLGSGFHKDPRDAIKAWKNQKHYAERMRVERHERG